MISTTSRTLKNRIDDENYFWLRRIENLCGRNNKFFDVWKKIIVKTPTETLKELSITCYQLKIEKRNKLDKLANYFHIGYYFFKISLWSPTHISTGSNNIQWRPFELLFQTLPTWGIFSVTYLFKGFTYKTVLTRWNL